MKDFDVIIVGAGASGIATAIAATKRGKKTAILEHMPKPLNKVLISGGGKCNFTNLNVSEKNYLCSNEKFPISALKNFKNIDFIELIKKHKIPFGEKTLGQLFCSNNSKDIIEVLIKESSKAEVFYNEKIQKISREDESFLVLTEKESYRAKKLVIASGGMSYPNSGATDIGYRIAKQFNLRIVPYKPALVPLNLDNELMKKTLVLQGVSVLAEVFAGEKKFRENILFTHFGLSGPAILQASLYWDKGAEICINLLPDYDVFEELKKLREISKGKKISNILNKYLPQKLVDFVVQNDDIFISEAANKTLKNIADRVNQWKIKPIGTQGFRLAEVTKGGVDVEEICQKTFESKKMSGLFFVGEILDVTGQLGGYNLQWAWSSGFSAGTYL